MKTIKRILITIVLIIAFAAAGLFYYGYRQYQAYESEADLITLVENVQSKQNFVSYDQLPESLVNATVSIEDRRYFSHGGVDYIGILRAIVSQFDDSYVRSGGSTIEQQTAKNLYQKYNSNFLDWKLAEFYFAKELEQNYSKEEIFALYVNIINYGDNNIGIWEASENYFGVEPSELTLAQSSLLAGIPQSPSHYQLSDHYTEAKQRQKLVLNAMVRDQKITQAEADEAYAEDVNLQ
ncbi:biosynthetic peptidoglycan transglycosylase [Catenisphaera adipataccumulans]|uniref:peptidoglycan glycosyltransferase n=1 Tax=Catenisphaera adipataccumulans TaxID=700500 RepID=A0A7W8FX13_9FIRM|nr:biosynthetic peptidoglycan transglycosylase [Catenisphaera adipataccumulans]MBB5183881.1 membrane peptidoglycan carboxypeptidase [Catenisphaera adipataccumulans]